MFICETCKTNVGPGVPPIVRVTAVREVAYKNIKITLDEYERETKEEVHSVGTEIVREVRECGGCAGELAPAPESKPLPLVLGKRFEEPLPEPFKTSFFNVVVNNMLHRRLDHKSKRAIADRDACVPLVKQFADANKDLVK